ncbi:PREDICTED: late blight resistance protein R1-A-like [Erythranthe guttata]|uniref:late blight resistance protein R1-A-like n=1 Tax=Erythranthe guttata TaxID=4155 RepID=UPI00064D79D7|nr:PREDICTED: late blight resistance protein R1-A-like [Erythranthe guttata]|eukprot:XP_012846813.1 PREDICTED: late blight resistance protein R1-A-like [Erythranthe guttata]
MAAYAALVSLINVLDHIQIHPRISNCFDKGQMESLSDHLNFLLDSVEITHSRGVVSEEYEVLEGQITSAAYSAEDVIESHVVDQIHSGSISFLDLQTVIQDMDYVKYKVVNFKEERRFKDRQKGPTYSLHAPPITSSCSGKSKMVGFDEELSQLLDALTGQQSSLQVISIVGMGGIDNNNGSRIILTTRLSNFASHFGSSSYFSKKFLDEDRSWKLFCEKEFLEKEVCPRELEKIGMKIAKKCKGLPLLIVVIGGLLRKSSRTQEYWENISENMNSILDSEEQNLDILSLSYSHLPAHLKPCFLYLAIFPEDCDIRVTELIKLWVAEGFIKPNKYQSLEKVAKEYVKDLVERNLLLVGTLRLNGKMKTCTIHDLLRDLCLKPAQKEKFLYLIKLCDTQSGIHKERRILFPEKTTAINWDSSLSHNHEPAPVTRSLLGKGGRLPFKFRLLRVLSVDYADTSLNDIFEQVNLRYVWTNYSYAERDHIHRALHLSLYLLWNVQTLKIGGTETLVAPSEIWSMPQLRHFEFDNGIYLPDPPLRSEQNDDGIVLKNLHTLKKVMNLKLSEEVCTRIPNVKILKIKYIEDLAVTESACDYCLYTIGRFDKLESLYCDFGNLSMSGNTPEKTSLLRNLKFPTSLQRLTLESSYVLDWEELSAIGSLPNLEILKLGSDSVRGSEWNPVEGEFLRLKYLLINYCTELKHWNAESVHFPVLESLVLNGFMQLDEIPSGIGEISTLALIQMCYCSQTALVSAIRILEEQESLENDYLRVRIQFWSNKEVERFKEKVASFESSESNNLQLVCSVYL